MNASSTSGRNPTKFHPNRCTVSEWRPIYSKPAVRDFEHNSDCGFAADCQDHFLVIANERYISLREILVSMRRLLRERHLYEISSESNVRFLNGIRHGKPAIRGFGLNFRIAFNGI
jgi:hypothetical protein